MENLSKKERFVKVAEARTDKGDSGNENKYRFCADPSREKC